MRNPKLRQLAELIGRTVGSVPWKLANFARLDPALHARGIRGAEHGAGGEAQVWAEFHVAAILECLAQRTVAMAEGKNEPAARTVARRRRQRLLFMIVDG